MEPLIGTMLGLIGMVLDNADEYREQRENVKRLLQSLHQQHMSFDAWVVELLWAATWVQYEVYTRGTGNPVVVDIETWANARELLPLLNHCRRLRGAPVVHV